MKFIKKTKKGEYEFSFNQLEVKDVFTSLDLIHKGMPADDLSLLLTKGRLDKMIKLLKKTLTDNQSIITK